MSVSGPVSTTAGHCGGAPAGRPLGARGAAKATVAERIAGVCFVVQNSFMSHLPLKNDRSGGTLQM